MGEGWGRRAIVALVIVLAVVDVAAWAYLFKRHPAKSDYVSRVTGNGLPPLAASPAPSPKATPSPTAVAPLPLPIGRAVSVSIVGDSLAIGRYASSPDTRFRDLVLTALGKRGPVTQADALPNGSGDLSTAVSVPTGIDLALIEVGTDDMAKEDAAAFNTAYAVLLLSIRNGSPNASIVCAGTWSANGGAYDAVIQRDCQAVKGRFVSLSSLYGVAANRGPAGVSGFYGTSDELAPNDAGHRAIAAALLGPVGVGLS